jgi:hypothetical protein
VIIPLSTPSANHALRVGATIRGVGSKLDADHPQRGVKIARRSTWLELWHEGGKERLRRAIEADPVAYMRECVRMLSKEVDLGEKTVNAAYSWIDNIARLSKLAAQGALQNQRDT